MERFQEFWHTLTQQNWVVALRKHWSNWRINYPTTFNIGRIFIFSTIAIITLIVIGGISIYFGAFGTLPSKQDLANIDNYTASEVYAVDGQLLGKYYVENRINAEFDELSPQLIHALVATEDARFFEHNGIDVRAWFRVLGRTILSLDESGGGGSTISQQLAKNVYKRTDFGLFSTPINKIREIFIARRLERIYSKEEILNIYLNTVPFSENTFGIKVAAQRFFKKSPHNLKTEEAATLIGMLKATTAYSPVRYPERATIRRNTVIAQMEKYGYLEKHTADSLQQLPLTIDYNKEAHDLGLATYFRAHLRLELEELLANYHKEDGSKYNLYTDGLKIYTTIHADLQRYAEEAVSTQIQSLQEDFTNHWGQQSPIDNSLLNTAIRQSERYKQLKAQGADPSKIDAIFKTPIPLEIYDWATNSSIIKTMSPLDSIRHHLMLLHAGFMALEPQTGAIRAWVGGIDYQTFKYDHVKSKRQVGSTFKPFVYAKALENGVSPCHYFPNILTIYSDYDDWKPENADGNYTGYYTLTGGLSESVNSISVNVLMEAGIDNVIELAHRIGINDDIPSVPSIALGTADLSLFDMLSAYSTLANGGQRRQPFYITHIETSEGIRIATFEPSIPQQALDKSIADQLTNMLEMVVENGTAKRLRSLYQLQNDIAGKTGTTQNQSDGWFIGYTPNIVAGAWVGANSPSVHWRSLGLGQGANTALPIWAKFIQAAQADNNFRHWKYARFPDLADSLQIRLDCPPYLEELPIVETTVGDTSTIFGRIINDIFEDRIQGRNSSSELSREREVIQRHNDKMLERREKKEKRKRFFNRIFKRDN